jgi:hypothetical protein
MPFSFQDILAREGDQASKTTTYHHVDSYDEDQKEGLLEQEEDNPPKRQKKSASDRWSRYSLPLSAALFLLSTMNIIFSIYRRPTEQQCVAKTSLWCESRHFLPLVGIKLTKVHE